jgi:inner membrane protein
MDGRRERDFGDGYLDQGWDEMVADGIHILLAIALFALVSRTDRVEAYLVVVIMAGLPDLDRYLFTPFIYSGYISGPIWTHRGITHSIFALLLFVSVAHLIGHWRAAVVGYGSHLAADFMTGGIRLFSPLTIRQHGLYYDWMLGNVIAGTFAALVIAGELLVRTRVDEADAGSRDSNDAPSIIDEIRRWFK